jgi:hypothetical protein
LETERDALARKENNRHVIHQTTQYSAEMGKVLVGGATAAIGGLAKSLQADASSTEITKGLMNAGIDMAAGVGKATGSVVSGLGSVASVASGFAKTPLIGKKLAFIGVGLDLLGGAIGNTSEGMAKLAKFGVEILSAEVEKTVKAFNTMSVSGAIFADGMQGMRDAASGAGLTVDQFSRVVQANSKTLGESGMGVAEGAAAMGRVGKIFDSNGGKMRTQMQKLGYGFEEQAALTAETMANMRRSSGGKSSDAAVAEQTQKYAENLRTIAQITGEDAAAKVKAVQQENQKLAFQQKMAEMSEGQRAQIDAAMATMTEQERKNLMDRVVFNGQVINQEGAMMESMNSAFAEKGRMQYEQLQRGELTAKSNADLNAQYGESIKEIALANNAFAVAAYASGGDLANVAKGMLDSINQANKYTTDAVKAAAEDQASAKDTNDKLTVGMTEAANAAQKLKLAMQQMMEGPIAKFASVSAAMLTTLQNMIAEAGLGGKGGAGGTEERGTATKIWDALKGAAVTGGIGAAGGAATGALWGGATGAVAGGVGAVPGAIAGAISGALWSGIPMALKGALEGWRGKATGGIAEGPTSGYLEKLHGTEAVIPTVGGKVPIDIRTNVGENAAASGNQLSEVADAMRQAMYAIKSQAAYDMLENNSFRDNSAVKPNYAEEKMMQQRTDEFQSNMIIMMQKFIESQQDMTSRLEEQIRQTEKLVSAAN